MKRSPMKRSQPRRDWRTSSTDARVRTCERCGETFYDTQASTLGQKFCSAKCFGEAQSEAAKASWPAKEEVERLYVDEGLSDRELGLRFGHSYQWAFKVREHYGIPGRRKKRPKPLTQRNDRARWGIHLKPEMWCRNCGDPGELHLHHAIPRSMSKAAKWDLRNGIPLCTRCHLGWHHRRVTICRDVFTAEEWAFMASLELTGQRIEAWLDDRYPELARNRICGRAA